jgi:hypothetical protein
MDHLLFKSQEVAAETCLLNFLGTGSALLKMALLAILKYITTPSKSQIQKEISL